MNAQAELLALACARFEQCAAAELPLDECLQAAIDQYLAARLPAGEPVADEPMVMPSGPWRVWWQGSGPERGDHIMDGRERIAYLPAPEGDGLHDAACAIEYAHNCAIARITAPPSAAVREAVLAELVERTEALIRYVEHNECQHEETHRGGAIWTICDGCGCKWADDEGGFQPYVEPAELTAARDAAIAARLSKERAQPVLAGEPEAYAVPNARGGIEWGCGWGFSQLPTERMTLALYTSPPSAAVREAVLAEQWDAAYRAFKGAFDTPAAWRHLSNEYADDARQRLREFDAAIRARTEQSVADAGMEQQP